ncbi:FtsK/SpoIIIE domain-containing protein [Singulisphaera acidiphila]|uniref:DNA segregation ATPase, FtsK/SpoIIIE family n=1 Tax=Singulisphaera acidiphila (strain ATCC BAA-1392 / DSM 18658 / VKM B-2454 / MOB10) TaxID=886293 RepID=L0DJ10_SINAD|nr:FtsK/SpoIIIE domain-containing protein [Singulisphaera acidiphila]AGA28803.1 DNA segregation ATPase, FtsK/SpoIIIE family [Singulisphaera acidiphila DSM 18658]
MSSTPRLFDPVTDPPQTLTPGPRSEPALIERERWSLQELLRLIAERAAAEVAVTSRNTTTAAAADQGYRASKQDQADRYTTRTVEDRKADEERRRKIVGVAIAGESEAKTEFAKSSRRIAADYEGARERAKQVAQRGKAEAAAAYEKGERDALARSAESNRPIDQAMKLVESMRERLAVVFANYRKFGLADPPTTSSRQRFEFEDPTGPLFDGLAKAEPDLALLEALYLPRMLKGNRYFWIGLVLFLILIVPAVKLSDPAIGFGVAVVGSAVLGYLLRSRIYAVAWQQVSRLYYPVFQSLVDTEAMATHFRTLATERLKTDRSQNSGRRENDLKQVKLNEVKMISEAEMMRDDRLRRINEVFAQRMVEIQTTQQTEMREAIASYERRQAEVRASYDASTQKLDEKFVDLKAKIQAQHETAWNELAKRWRGGIEQVLSTLEDVRREVDGFGPRWDDPAWNDRPLPRVVSPVLRLGEVRVELDGIPDGVSADPRLMDLLPPALTIPALLPFPSRMNLLVETPGEGKGKATDVLQGAMLRLLTSLPPGQVRFTIIDPIGIGRSFGAFMHLADFDEALVTSQVWTEPRQIEERLADLSAHMEKVTQKYLRNEYATIEEYNAVAEEVAEPYRVLVVADFPAGFDEKTAARLASIAAAGVPCGVLTLVVVDRDRPLPTGFSLEDLRRSAVVLSWEEGRLVWDDPGFSRYPLVLDPPAPAEFATRLIVKTGAAARDARRVEVPFEFISPPAELWWTKDSRAGIDIPLGKAGATKRQHLTLGQGTSQHVLLAGRTGSGKSTLLHALITNLALNYSPDEIDLYLIDFKKGVEFKVYATQELPHASVVAIESEREFGISVLQRLDAAMRERADRFRDAGVQDLNGYRNAPGTPPLPRILLIVDEFQEFFVEEDKLAQEAALLLDRLVRQGRAFGVHVHLGSQSLGGAYALARTTLGQMAVRIALQCSDSDAALILSEQNPAAHLLSRPGEAVYNDANGLVEGNHFFQVVWLSDERREAYLKQIRELARERKPVLARTPLVFEGDAQADLARNPLLKARLEPAIWPPSPRSAHAWLGDPVAIKDPTSALFRRQGGSHLLIVGQNDESALGIMSASLVSLAAQYPPPDSDTTRSGARFFVLDGTPEDHLEAGLLTRVAGLLPQPVQAGGWRDAARIVAEVAKEVERRQQPDAPDGPELFLLVHDLPRFRDLRKRENDYGFSRRDEEASPSDHFATIVREGPSLGVHLLTWCDNLNNLNRYFDHQMLREFELRVLFQMSPNDSGHLLDAPHASRLGPHRALFSSEEQNRLEKFRPYGLPDEAWLEQFRAQLHKRAEANSTESSTYRESEK